MLFMKYEIKTSTSFYWSLDQKQTFKKANKHAFFEDINSTIKIAEFRKKKKNIFV